MPFLPGDELARVIRNTPELTDLSIIIFSAALDGKEKTTKAGVSYFLNKPFNMGDLLNTIHTALNQSIN